MFVETLKCPECKMSSIMALDDKSVALWKSGVLVQDAFPDLSQSEREQLITGIHPDCWIKIFAHPFSEWENDVCGECGEPKENEMHND